MLALTLSCLLMFAFLVFFFFHPWFLCRNHFKLLFHLVGVGSERVGYVTQATVGQATCKLQLITIL